jgi:1,2-diacylglycerol 3-alpha-glucosyltransferase
MKVLMVNPHFWPTATGSATVTRQLSRELAARGHEVTVLTVTPEERIVDETLDGFRILRVPSRGMNVGRLAFNYNLPFVTRVGVRDEIGGILDRVEPDIVHLHGQFWDLCQWAGGAARKRSVPVVLSVHTAIVNDGWALDAVAAGIDRAYVRPIAKRITDVWTGYDKRVIDYIASRYGVKDAEFLPNPVEMGMFAGGDGARVRTLLGLPTEPIILSVGHVIPLRNRLPLVRALPEILRSAPEVRVVVVGEVYHREFLDLAESLGVAEHVVTVGRIPHEEMPDWVAAATVEAHDLHGHGLGVASLEVMSSGVPCVVVMRPDHFPGVDLRDYPDFPLLPDENPDALAREIIHLIDDLAARDRAAAAGGAICERVFATDVVIRECERIYAVASARASR